MKRRYSDLESLGGDCIKRYWKVYILYTVTINENKYQVD